VTLLVDVELVGDRLTDSPSRDVGRHRLTATPVTSSGSFRPSSDVASIALGENSRKATESAERELFFPR
jgi:hypothetical protein